MLLVPSIFVASTTLSFDANFRTNIAFVLSGPICLGMASLFCYGKRITPKEITSVLLYMVLPIIALTAYIYLYNPSIKDVLSNTMSNREASGGWGPNQVATALGLGIIILTMRVFLNSPTLLLKIVNSILLALMGYRAIVTFSRGGVFAAIITIAVFLFIFFLSSNYKQKSKIILMSLLLAFVLAGTWVISSQQTRGYIDLRYANKDHLGREKGDLTTGRKELFLKELEGFMQQPFLGIGSSRAKDQRIEIEGQGVTSHSEVSRTLAEHGILGIVVLLILIFKPLELTKYNSINYFFYAFLCFWFLTVNHSSMRIAAPAFVYALALLNVRYEKPPVHRERLV
ncbi:MAG: O-antigen ligase domain-containing protein [Flavobacteriaceae bacterium]|nr:O-antigen ligase domain-containing protein [Flavobacteriaceae bacterium]